MKLYIIRSFHDHICSFIKKGFLILKKRSEINSFTTFSLYTFMYELLIEFYY